MCRNSREIIFRFNCMAAFSYLLTILQNSFSPKSRDRWMIKKKLFQQTLNRCFSYIRSTEIFFFAKFGLWRSTVTLMPVGKHSSQSPFSVWSYMSIGEFGWPPSWSLDVSETKESRKCLCVRVVGLKNIFPPAEPPPPLFTSILYSPQFRSIPRWHDLTAK